MSEAWNEVCECLEDDWEIVPRAMPTKAESPAPTMSIHHSRTRTQDSSHTWTDDLPVCHLSGVGVATNQIYREDGQRREEHEFEDRSFHFKLNDTTFLYGLFDGHDGCRASDFAAQKIPAELLLGQLSGRVSDEEVRYALEQAFIAVEKGFFQSIDDLLAQKTVLQMQLPEELNAYETYQKYPEEVAKIQALDVAIAGGTTAIVALIHNQKLYVANVGDSRALLCKDGPSGELLVQQLSIDHDIRNEDERLRLKTLGLDVEKLLQGSKLGNQDNTRCVGNYMVKGGYKDFDILSTAREEPVVAEPDICGGIELNSSCRFLLLMSDGLYRSLEEATETTEANREIAQMVLDQFAVQSTLMGVAQAVVDRVVRIHHDTYMCDPRKYQRRDDITLLVRRFNQPLPNAPSPSQSPLLHSFLSPSMAATATATTSSSTTTTTMDTVPFSRTVTDHRSNRFPIDEDGLIEPYVDFTDFYRALEETQQTTFQE